VTQRKRAFFFVKNPVRMHMLTLKFRAEKASRNTRNRHRCTTLDGIEIAGFVLTRSSDQCLRTDFLLKNERRRAYVK
jgi:hypothetical protein